VSGACATFARMRVSHFLRVGVGAALKLELLAYIGLSLVALLLSRAG